uniref:Uncharacterized protein n=1 Tax=Arundo donax TaxID=35708 RepID=A0A0A9C394_ARUDO
MLLLLLCEGFPSHWQAHGNVHQNNVKFKSTDVCGHHIPVSWDRLMPTSIFTLTQSSKCFTIYCSAF